MSVKHKSKSKILYLMEIFERKTDDDHILSASALCESLREYDIDAERKSIYADIESLRDFGMNIINTRSPGRGYFLASRKFELAEIRLLIDAVQAAYFIPPGKTKTLINKIGLLVSDSQMNMLKKQVYIESRLKSSNEQIYYTIDVIHRAITLHKQIEFIYSKKIVLNYFSAASEDKDFVVNPYALIWSSDHYYLICNKTNYDNLMHVRLDRMKKVELLDTDARHFSEVCDYKNSFDSADYSSKLFNMFSGAKCTVELVCSNSIIEEITDRFGEKSNCRRYDNEHFIIKTEAVVSEGLVSWIMQFGSRIAVKSPDSLKESVLNRAKEIVDICSKKF